MFNNKFILLATVFGSRVRCEKEVRHVYTDGDFSVEVPVTNAGSAYKVIGILEEGHGIEIMVQDLENQDVANTISLKELQDCFSLAA